jgi:hypothetical protein
VPAGRPAPSKYSIRSIAVLVYAGVRNWVVVFRVVLQGWRVHGFGRTNRLAGDQLLRIYEGEGEVEEIA